MQAEPEHRCTAESLYSRCPPAAERRRYRSTRTQGSGLSAWARTQAGKQSHRAISLALASTQETALTAPTRRAACRALISCRQASVIEASSLLSMLSSKATVKAARSSGGNPRASSRMRFMWAFMRRSLAANRHRMMTTDPQGSGLSAWARTQAQRGWAGCSGRPISALLSSGRADGVPRPPGAPMQQMQAIHHMQLNTKQVTGGCRP